MIEWIQQIDALLFSWIHTGLSNGFFDIVMPIIRNRDTWIPLYIALVVLILYFFKKDGIWILLGVVIVVALSDQISSTLLKHLIGRIRPCHIEALQVDALVRCSPSFSFPSSHATNHFSLSIFLGCIFYSYSKWPMLLGVSWALSICFAQVYVGVHFPLDILAGILLGSSIGSAGFFVLTKFVNLNHK